VSRHENTKNETTKKKNYGWFHVFEFRVFVMAFVVVGCNKAPVESPAGAPAAEPPKATVPHGDHKPHHGGVVMMKGNDLHYEVVLDKSGTAQLFFTDAIREDLPASIATGVSLTIRRPGAPDEPVAMRIDEFGESWIGSGRPISITPDTTVRVAFTVHQEPYWIDVPYANPPAQR
jgi:hypothetical protein